MFSPSNNIQQTAIPTPNQASSKEELNRLGKVQKAFKLF
jgi:hypothetical protein